MAESHWSLNPSSHALTVGTLLDCVAELGNAAQGLVDKRVLFDGDGGWRVLQSIVRQMSVPLRKLCLDNNGALLRTVVANPTFHPLWRKQRQVPPGKVVVAHGPPGVGTRE